MVVSATISTDNHTHSPPPDDLQRRQAEPPPLTPAAVGVSTTTAVCHFSDGRRVKGLAAAGFFCQTHSTNPNSVSLNLIPSFNRKPRRRKRRKVI
ncbi:hypothetical protein HanIR_Chr15g0784051 [Helianthus annuus]|nr:hypothetical protein HanIR_Chr15g0784051 [Helianthus annuus]